MNLTPASPPQQYPEVIRTSLERYMADLAIKTPSLRAHAKERPALDASAMRVSKLRLAPCRVVARSRASCFELRVESMT